MRGAVTLVLARRMGAEEGMMAKVLILLHKRADLTTDEFRRYWRETHAPLGARLPGVRGYVQDHVLPGEGQMPCDGIAELRFDSPEAFQAALGSSEGQAALADVENFCDAGRTQVVLVDEVIIA